MRALPLLLLCGCLVNTALYDERLDALSAQDLDGDGASGAADCDDTDPTVFVGAEELCDDKDNNCDGDIDEGVTLEFWPDADGDSFGGEGSVFACSAPADHVDVQGDCDDTDPTVFVGAEELCDGLDNDCNGTPDDGPTRTFYADADGDGHGTPAETAEGSCPPDGFAVLDDDCDDGDPTRAPSIQEICNDGHDDDCDGAADDLDDDTSTTGMTAWWPDLDRDGFGDGDLPQLSCIVPLDGIDNGEDCNDTDPLEGRPGFWREDIDDDGFGGPETGPICKPARNWVPGGTPEDCDEGDRSINPGAFEICDDGIDQNCTDEDARCHPSLTLWSGGTLADAEAAWTGRLRAENAGVVVASAGDQTGNGRDDLLIGATGFTDGNLNQGAVYVVGAPAYGTFDLAETDHARLVGEAAGDKLGRGLAGGADLDGDGQADVVAGAWQASGGAFSAGKAYVAYGPLEGDIRMPDLPTLYGESFNDRCCQEITLDDLSGDGQADIVLGSEYATIDDNSSAGAVHVFVTQPGRRIAGDLPLSDADLIVFGASAEDQVGKAVGVSDFDADGNNDLAVGAFKVDPSIILVDAGAVSIFYGGGPLGMFSADDADARFLGASSGDRAGEGVTTGGDLNGDGYDDLVISSRLNDHLLREDSGKVYIIDGAGGWPVSLNLRDATDNFIYGEVADARIGRSNTIVRSYDGTDSDWLVIGADTSPIGGEETGAVYFIPGDTLTGAIDLADADRVLRGEGPTHQAGYSIANVGDVDRDGWEDVLIGAYKYDGIEENEGKVYLIYGTDL